MHLHIRADAALPRTRRSPLRQGAAFISCLALVAFVLYGESHIPRDPALGGFLLIAVLIGTWLLSSYLAALVVALALATPWITARWGVVEVTTAAFQFASVLVCSALSEVIVRGLQTLDRQQRDAAENLRRFTADAAHELRTPIAGLRSDLETTLARPRSTIELTESLERALTTTERLGRLSESLLTLARGDAGVLATPTDLLDLADSIEEALSRWERTAQKQGVRLTCDVIGSGSIRGDPILISRLLDNLLENAVRHTPPAGTVTLGLRPSEEAHWDLSVSDSGPGIPASMRPRLFERFVREDASRSRATGGAGLGLALCATIARAHGGMIWARDDCPGASFVVRIPDAAQR